MSASTETLNKFKSLPDSNCTDQQICGVEITEIKLKQGDVYSKITFSSASLSSFSLLSVYGHNDLLFRTDAIARKCVSWLGNDAENRKQDCTRRSNPADGVFVMVLYKDVIRSFDSFPFSLRSYNVVDSIYVFRLQKCTCETHFCNGWTFESMRERFYTEFTRLVMTNALVEGDAYPEYTGPMQAQYVPNTADFRK